MKLTDLMCDEDFKSALSELGVTRGDCLQLHTSIFDFGAPLITPRKYLASLCKILFDAVGESGTIAMPTFTYSFCDGKIYDREQSKSKMGALNEFFRKNYARRTLDPNFSFAVWGAKSDYLLGADTRETFGEDGIFAKLKNINAKILDIGETRDLTFFHLIERAAGVSYRFDKKFTGVIKNRGKTFEAQNVFFCRALDRPSRCDFARIYAELKSNLKNYKEVKIAKTKMIIFDSNEVFDFCVRLLREDEEYFLIKDIK